MEMSNREIVHRYVDLETPISILAELNAVSNDMIRDVLVNEGVIIGKGTLRPKRHIVDPKPAKPYQGESKTRKPYTKSGLYTKAAKAERALNRKNNELKKVLNDAGYKTSDNNQQNAKETKKDMPIAKPLNQKKKLEAATESLDTVSKKLTAVEAKAAEPEMSETVRKIIFNRLDELDIKMSYHQEQLREYEREYKELTKTLGIKRVPNEF